MVHIVNMNIWSRILGMAYTLFSPHRASGEKSGRELACQPVHPQCQNAIIFADDNCGPDPGDVSFTAAIIGLGAKLAKADGLVTHDEVEMFARVFRAAPEDMPSVQRVFNIARQTVRGYEGYAKRIAKRYGDRPCLLEGILDGLFQIALADGIMTLDELEYIRSVSDLFGFSDADFKRIKATHMGLEKDDPYRILGLAPDAEYEDVRRQYRKLMRDHHPDRIVATKKATRDYEQIAHEKAASITAAFAKIRSERGIMISVD